MESCEVSGTQSAWGNKMKEVQKHGYRIRRCSPHRNFYRLGGGRDLKGTSLTEKKARAGGKK